MKKSEVIPGGRLFSHVSLTREARRREYAQEESILKRGNRFRGGYRFGSFEGTPVGPVDLLPRPATVSISMVQGADGPVTPTVQVGDRVLRGQAIALDPEYRFSPIHASITGTVKEIGPTTDRGMPVPSYVVIGGEQSEEKVNYRAIGENFRHQPKGEVARLLFEAGVTCLDRPGIPTAANMRGADPAHLDVLIVTALDTGILAPKLADLLGNRLHEFAVGIHTLRYALGIHQTYVGIDSREWHLARELAEHVATTPDIEIRRLEPVYPQHYDEMMVEVLTGRRVPNNGRSLDVGVVCVNALTALAAYDAIARAEPVLDQVMILGGSGYAQPGLVRAPIGMSLEEVIRPRLKNQEVRIVVHGLLTGQAVDPKKTTVTRGLLRVDAVIENRERVILAFLRPGTHRDAAERSFLAKWLGSKDLNNDTNLHGEERPCICCNRCDEVCPRNLMPYWLSKHVHADMAVEAEEFRLSDCIECGLCSYVCPSKISLMEDIQQGKKMLSEEPANA
jgi:electron transport complex protein RnfC